MLVEGARERDTPNGGHIVESGKCSFIYWFTNDCQVCISFDRPSLFRCLTVPQLFTNGTLRAHFDASNKIEMLDIGILDHNEFIPRRSLVALEQQDQKQSPKMTKNTAKRAQPKQAPQPSVTLPESMVTANGVPPTVMSFLEVSSRILAYLADLYYPRRNSCVCGP